MSEPIPSADRAAARAAMVAHIERLVMLTQRETGITQLDPAVAAALRAVPRHRFVPERVQAQAYDDCPLPIGLGQTISQPYIVAISTQLLAVGPGARVCELGTGSGYQAAVLAALGAEVYSLEIIPELAARAAAVLAELGYERVQVRTGDGCLGWPEAAPFDAVIVTAAGPEVPPALFAQLKPGGRLLIPLGAAYGTQYLTRCIKTATGTMTRDLFLPVRFVPITGPSAG